MAILSKPKFVNVRKVIKKYPNAHYYVLIGERSNGKTFSVEEYALEDYVKNGRQLGLVRRWQDDFKGKRGQKMFDALVHDANGKNHIEELTEGKFNTYYYYSGQWFLARQEKGTITEKDTTPFCIAFGISANEHDKSTSYPLIGNILFDEFISRNVYLPDEFILFSNVLSTIIRIRDDIKIFMCGNTINQYCPYFEEMGLKNIRSMNKGDIDLYTYGESDLKVVVYFTDSPEKVKKSNVYFAFNNPKLSMITGQGNIWEIDIYPHLPTKYKQSEILFTYFIEFGDDTLQCEIVHHGDSIFTYIHRKTSDIKNPERDVIFSEDYKATLNHRRKLLQPFDRLGEKIAWFYNNNKVFYQNNEVGEIVRNYLLWSSGRDKSK